MADLCRLVGSVLVWTAYDWVLYLLVSLDPKVVIKS
jgi:hypothetical protein